MATTVRAPRSYPKGVARRAQILQAALEAYATSGKAGPSLRSIADEVGLTEAGVLHYFPSKEHLLVEILVARDQADLARPEAALPWPEVIWALLERTLATPGLVKLYVDMSAAAADPSHPAFAYLTARQARLVARLQGMSGSDDVDWRIPLMIAALEGLQVQWLRDPTVDVIGGLKQLFATLV